jgi:transcriptional regulator with XRE-family HTH domain
MDGRGELGEFLTSRRARLTPAQAGLPDFGGRRRVPGLRRDEVALLAGVSVQYYTRFERGSATGVSEGVLDGVSRALQLTEAEHRHLYDLVRAAHAGVGPLRRRTTVRQQQVPESVQQTLDAMADLPAFVQNGRLDMLATNRMFRAMFSAALRLPQRPANFARFVFLEPQAHEFYPDWDENAHQVVALLRAEAGRSPHDRLLSDLVGELSVQSEPFRRLWASHDVREHRFGQKSVRHPVVGDLDLTYQAMDLSTERGLQLIVYTARPASPSADALALLSSWSATHEADVVPQDARLPADHGD